MKCYFLLSACLFSLFSQAQTTYFYKVEGKMRDNSMNGKTLYITRYDNQQVIDSTKVTNQNFIFEGKTDAPYFCRIDAGTEYANFILDNGTSQVDVYTHNQPTGTKLNELLTQAMTTSDSLQEISYTCLEKIKKEKPNVKDWQPIWLETFNKEFRPMILGYLKERILSNKNNGVGQYAFMDYSRLCNPDEMENLYKEIGDWLPSLESVQKITIRFKALKESAEGKPFLDITGESIDGKELHLSDFVGKGKYVLADMWASWCGPCREEIPNLAEIHNKYKEKGLVVLGIATWDKTANIIKAVKELNITWPQLLDTQEKAMELYGINGIPHIILFGPDGTIIARNLRGESMKLKVEEVMQNKL